MKKLILTVALLSAAPAVAQEQGEASQSGTTETSPLDFSDLLKSLRAIQQPDYDTSKPVVGFGLQKIDDETRISQILNGSSAEKAALEVGMVILRINGVQTSEFTLPEIIRILGAIDGQINLDIEGKGRFSLVKAPIEKTK